MCSLSNGYSQNDSVEILCSPKDGKLAKEQSSEGSEIYGVRGSLNTNQERASDFEVLDWARSSLSPFSASG